jgi:ACT domain-containing protein
MGANKDKEKSTQFDTIKKEAMIEALNKTLGIVTEASKAVGIHRSTHYKWMKDDEDYKGSVDDLKNKVLDMAESVLHSLIRDDRNVTAIIYYLNNKGKSRGYNTVEIEKESVRHEIILTHEPSRSCQTKINEILN